MTVHIYSIAILPTAVLYTFTVTSVDDDVLRVSAGCTCLSFLVTQYSSSSKFTVATITQIKHNHMYSYSHYSIFM